MPHRFSNLNQHRGPSHSPGRTQERQVRSWLIGGFVLMIGLIVTDGIIGFSTIVSIRESVSGLTEGQFRRVALIDEVQRAQSVLGTVLFSLSAGQGTPDRAELKRTMASVEGTLKQLFSSIPHNDPDAVIWRDAELAYGALTSELDRVLDSPVHHTPDTRKLLQAREDMVAVMARLTHANHGRAEAISRNIAAVATNQLVEDGVLLTGCVVLACLCMWLVLKISRVLYDQITQQHNELLQVSWQLLEKQEHLARRLSHELHDELGQSLTALKTNFSRYAGEPHIDKDWMADCSQLLKESIRSAHEISQLLRPTILDDFGLHSALSWLCDRFEERNGIRVRYVVDDSERLGAETETHLFRIAQEALTNVAKHARCTEVTVALLATDGGLRLSITDNGVGLPAEFDPSVPHFGLTGMRARARSLRGEMVVRSEPGKGTEIEITFPLSTMQHEETHSSFVGR